MFLKLLVSVFSLCILVKNFSYAKYEYKANKNIVGSLSIAIFSLISILFLNYIIFFIKF